MKKFSYDENNMLAIYNAGTREETIHALQKMRGYLEPHERALIALTDSTIQKLQTISDQEFDALELFLDE